jgi:hypothetical protein
MLSPSADAMPQVDLRLSLAIDVVAEAGIGNAIKGIQEPPTLLLGPKAFGGTVKEVKALQLHEDLSAAIRAGPRCFVLVDRSPELCANSSDPLDRLLDLLAEQIEKDLSTRRRLTPLQTGWRAVSLPVRRDTPRGSGLHCFAEPLIGLGEFVPRHIALENIGTNTVWRPKIDDTLFVVRGQ